MHGFEERSTEEKTMPLLRGTMHRAIVLKSPNENFSEAIFILSDSFAQREGVSRKELLRQAGEAAGMYCPPRRKRLLIFAPAALFVMGAASAILLLWAFGIIGTLV